MIEDLKLRVEEYLRTSFGPMISEADVQEVLRNLSIAYDRGYTDGWADGYNSD